MYSAKRVTFLMMMHMLRTNNHEMHVLLKANILCVQKQILSASQIFLFLLSRGACVTAVSMCTFCVRHISKSFTEARFLCVEIYRSFMHTQCFYYVKDCLNN